MREEERIDRICDKLKEFWKLHPDQRLGQLLENYIFYKGTRGDNTSVHLFYQEDDYTEAIIVGRLEQER